MAKFPNLVVVHTFSKSRALAGLRASFAVASPGLVPALERVRDWYNSYTSTASPRRAPPPRSWTPIGRRADRQGGEHRERFAAALEAKGWSVLPSQANFFAAHPSRSAQEVLGMPARSPDPGARAFRGARLDKHGASTSAPTSRWTRCLRRWTDSDALADRKRINSARACYRKMV
ncbi:MAG: aminotransferase class I/II-fold pyridoxal phosphate-dependent enzyme [Fibrobacteres bacterium]|nr:aminotransferase class I/II-fold pyridoxal phosphate-dependent enzyme [Fibrobacterota bacterium]